MTAKWGRGRLGGRGIEQKEKRFMLSGSLKGAGALSARAPSGQVGGEPVTPVTPATLATPRRQHLSAGSRLPVQRVSHGQQCGGCRGRYKGTKR